MGATLPASLLLRKNRFNLHFLKSNIYFFKCLSSIGRASNPLFCSKKNIFSLKLTDSGKNPN